MRGPGRPAGVSVHGLRGQPDAVPGGQPARERAGRGHGDLLAEDCADGELEPVVSAWHTQPGPGRHQGGDQVVGGQSVTDRPRIGVGVEQPPGPADYGPIAPSPVSRARSSTCPWPGRGMQLSMTPGPRRFARSWRSRPR